MIEFILHLIVSAVVLMVVARLLDGFTIRSFTSALIGALVLGLVNALIRPVTLILSIPLTVLTLGLFIFVVNALMLMLATAITPGVQIRGLWTAILASVIISLFNIVVGWIF